MVTMNTSGNTATIANSGNAVGNFGWAIPLAQGDTGIRSVQSITFLGAVGGIFSLVLCKPMSLLSLLENSITSEKDFFLEDGFRISEIKDGAYLNFICLPGATLASVLINGYNEFIWG